MCGNPLQWLHNKGDELLLFRMYNVDNVVTSSYHLCYEYCINDESIISMSKYHNLQEEYSSIEAKRPLAKFTVSEVQKRRRGVLSHTSLAMYELVMEYKVYI